MALTKYLKNLQRSKPKEYREIIRKRLVEWRRDSTPLRIDHPTNLATARKLGYKAKHGYIVIRVRVPRGQKKRPRIKHGRRSAHMRSKLVLKRSYQSLAEIRANKRFINLEVLNSYKAGQDGLHYWFEVILIDREHPEIKADKKISWISTKRGRAQRGLTSAGKKGRGMRGKGKGHEKVRPSLAANKGRAK